MAMTPGDAIRKQCIECYGGVFAEVHTCDAGKMCVFHKYRLGRGRPSVKIIRKFCLNCMCGSYEAVKDCTTEDCTLYPYRFGKSVNRQEMSQERKDQLAKILSRRREIKRTRTKIQQPVISRRRTKS